MQTLIFTLFFYFGGGPNKKKPFFEVESIFLVPDKSSGGAEGKNLKRLKNWINHLNTGL